MITGMITLPIIKTSVVKEPSQRGKSTITAILHLQFLPGNMATNMFSSIVVGLRL